MSRRLALVAVISMVAGCGPWQRVGTERPAAPAATILPLFDPSAIYRSMGFVVSGPPLPFVASLGFLAGPTPDSTLAAFGLSLANHSLTFRRSDSGFVAHYRVEVTLRADTASVRRVGRDATVRVRSFQETLRADESIVFQEWVTLPPGVYGVKVVVEDRDGPAVGRQEIVDTVPRFQGQALGGPIAVYEGGGRENVGERPVLLVNPRATLAYGADSLRLYVETYGLPEGTRVAGRVVDADGAELWRDTITATPGLQSPEGDGPVGEGAFVVAPGVLPVGRAEFRVEAVGTSVNAVAPLLVTFSDTWVVTNFEQMVQLLRYFDPPALVAKLAAAPREERATAWQEFYKASDPVPITPENEALDEYFQRVDNANRRFQEPGAQGWQTERGEVLIMLGEPDDVQDASNQVTSTDVRYIRWGYVALRLTLYFQDEVGFGQYRLTPLSRSEFQRVLERIRRSQ
ncbi:MAG TPA: GWxTD domain-containing protein [Gemmatimonadales bacterium]|nr:GWxTD domain-containing protein [Gemmatimonadales bacterium]